MNWKLIAAAAVATTLCACGQSENPVANEDDGEASAQVSDCYEQAGEGFTQPKSRRALFVVVDQSTGLDDHLRETVADNVKELLQPGTTYAVYTFSAYSKGRYPTPVASGEIAAAVPEEKRGDLSVRRLNRLDQCLARQEKQVVSEMEAALDKATSASSSEFANSEIMASLEQISKAVQESNASNKLVLVVSDLLEHSSSTSFYRNKNVRSIDPQAEIDKARKQDLVADFDGAKVAVVGAGLLSPESGEGATRDTAALGSLHRFWEAWFEASNAEIVQYGQPDLITPLTWGGNKKS